MSEKNNQSQEQQDISQEHNGQFDENDFMNQSDLQNEEQSNLSQQSVQQQQQYEQQIYNEQKEQQQNDENDLNQQQNQQYNNEYDGQQFQQQQLMYSNDQSINNLQSPQNNINEIQSYNVKISPTGQTLKTNTNQSLQQQQFKESDFYDDISEEHHETSQDQQQQQIQQNQQQQQLIINQQFQKPNKSNQDTPSQQEYIQVEQGQLQKQNQRLEEYQQLSDAKNYENINDNKNQMIKIENQQQIDDQNEKDQMIQQLLLQQEQLKQELHLKENQLQLINSKHSSNQNTNPISTPVEQELNSQSYQQNYNQHNKIEQNQQQQIQKDSEQQIQYQNQEQNNNFYKDIHQNVNPDYSSSEQSQNMALKNKELSEKYQSLENNLKNRKNQLQKSIEKDKQHILEQKQKEKHFKEFHQKQELLKSYTQVKFQDNYEQNHLQQSPYLINSQKSLLNGVNSNSSSQQNLPNNKKQERQKSPILKYSYKNDKKSLQSTQFQSPNQYDKEQYFKFMQSQNQSTQENQFFNSKNSTKDNIIKSQLSDTIKRQQNYKKNIQDDENYIQYSKHKQQLQQKQEQQSNQRNILLDTNKLHFSPNQIQQINGSIETPIFSQTKSFSRSPQNQESIINLQKLRDEQENMVQRMHHRSDSFNNTQNNRLSSSQSGFLQRQRSKSPRLAENELELHLKERYIHHKTRAEDAELANEMQKKEIFLLQKDNKRLLEELDHYKRKSALFQQEIKEIKYELEESQERLRHDVLVHKAEKLLSAYEEKQIENNKLRMINTSQIEDINLQQQQINKMSIEITKYKNLFDDLCIDLKCSNIVQLQSEFKDLILDNKRKSKLFSAFKEIMRQCQKLDHLNINDISEKQCFKWFQSVFEEYLDLKMWKSNDDFLIQKLISQLEIEDREQIIPVFTERIFENQTMNRIMQKLKKFLHIHSDYSLSELEKLVEVELARKWF